MTPDARRARAVDTGMWLFLASLVMFYASLFSGYVLLRAGSETWQTPWLVEAGGLRWPWVQTLWLVSVCAATWRWDGTPLAGTARWWPLAAALVFTFTWLRAASALASMGQTPASSVAVASWYVLTGAVAAGVLGGGAASAWILGQAQPAAHVTRQLRRYWLMMLALWLSLVIGLYLL